MSEWSGTAQVGGVLGKDAVVAAGEYLAVVRDGHAVREYVVICIVRMRHHAPTRAYVERRTTEGLSKREIIRCLKRYIAREVFAALPRPNPPTATVPAAA